MGIWGHGHTGVGKWVDSYVGTHALEHWYIRTLV
jgi:hypothetical protein